jgi:TPR repeat protein
MRGAYLGAVGAASFLLALLGPSLAHSREKLADACLAKGDSASCEWLANRLARGDEPRRFPEEAGLYFALACQGGVAGACSRAQAWAEPYADYEAFETDAGCMLRGNAFACEEVANALREESEEHGTPAALPVARARARRALALYREGCDKDDAASCLGASRVHASGFGVPYSPREMRANEARACALGLEAGCEAQGDHAAGESAIAAYDRACHMAPVSPYACLKLARALEAGDASLARANPSALTSLPTPRTADAYRHACDLLAVDACAWVSRH